MINKEKKEFETVTDDFIESFNGKGILKPSEQAEFLHLLHKKYPANDPLRQGCEMINWIQSKMQAYAEKRVKGALESYTWTIEEAIRFVEMGLGETGSINLFKTLLKEHKREIRQFNSNK